MRLNLLERLLPSLSLIGGGMLLFGGFFASGTVSAAEVSEDAAKAEFVFRIIQFVDWEFTASSDVLEVGVIGDARFATVLESVVSGRKIQGRHIAVKTAESISGLGESQVVFFPGSNRRRMAAMLDEIKDPKLLTLGDSEAFLKAGGMISIVVSRAGKIRLGAERKVLDRSGLKVSSKLMRILTR